MPGLTPACGTMLAECAAVCLEDRAHLRGTRLHTSGHSICDYQLEWGPVDDQQRRCYKDLQEATERGATAIAILVLKELTDLVVIERSKKGPGFDYWIGKDDDDLLPFANKARLEVSGILDGTTSEINTRIKQKRQQISPSDGAAPGYIAVVEFSRPLAHVELK
jgi:hypothetical protein